MREYDNIPEDPRDNRNDCLKTKSLGFETLDRKIAAQEQSVKYLEYELKSQKLRLAQLKKVRKLVTPEMEQAVRAFREVGMI